MGTKSILKKALAAEKGVNLLRLKEKKKQKESRKRKANGRPPPPDPAPPEDDEWEDEPVLDQNGHDQEGDDDEAEGASGMKVNALDFLQDSDDSDSSIEMEEKLPRQKKILAAPPESSRPILKRARRQEEEDDEDIPFSDLEDLSDEDRDDLIPHTRLTINNTTALLASLQRIQLPKDLSVASFSTHMSLVGTGAPTVASIPDIADDLQRETALLGQSLEAARRARALLKAEGVPFSRPGDYFAEMVKPDAHMEKVKAKMVEEASARKASAEAKRLRELKKFGKQVQVAKLQERAKAKKEALEKIKVLKRKRQESSGDLGTTEADLFDVAVDDEIQRHSKKQKTSGSSKSSREDSRTPNKKRQHKNEKFGFGGKKRHAKSGDAVSSGDLSGFNGRKSSKPSKSGGIVKSKPTKSVRLGKSRRKSQASKR